MGCPSENAPASYRPGWWHACLAAGILCAGAALHLAYLIRDCPLDLSGDEAHYWEWSRRLDWSYYSKGPLVAYIIALGRWALADWSQRVVGSEMLAVRLPAIVLSIGSGLAIYTLALRAFRRPGVALAAVILTCTVPILAVGAVLTTIDAPLTFCFLWGLVACERGLRGPETWPWIVAGVLIALGILAKYTMLLIFPVVGLAMLLEREYRPAWRRPGPYVAAGLGALGFVPILIWNARHGWVSFRHVAGQAGVSGSITLNVAGVAEYVLGQAAVIGPIWFFAMLVALVALWRRPDMGGGARPVVRLVLCAVAVPWVAFLLFSPITKVQPNWPVLSVPPATILLAGWLAHGLRSPAREVRRWTRGLVVAGTLFGGGSVILAHYTEALLPVFGWLARHEPPWEETPVAKYDPASRLRGWRMLGPAVGRHLTALQAQGRDPFIVTDDYQVASQIAFYCPGHPPVYCLQAVLGDRASQYDIWPNPIRDAERFVGRPCVYVGARKPELFGGPDVSHVALRDARLVETVEYRLRGHLIRVWPVYMCEEYAGLPPELLSRVGARY